MIKTSNFYAKGKLNDKKIVECLGKAVQWYEDGAILETRDLIAVICEAITYWEQELEQE